MEVVLPCDFEELELERKVHGMDEQFFFNIKDAEIHLDHIVDKNYGADADGNRGIYYVETNYDWMDLKESTIEFCMHECIKVISFNKLKKKNKKRIFDTVEAIAEEYDYEQR